MAGVKRLERRFARSACRTADSVVFAPGLAMRPGAFSWVAYAPGSRLARFFRFSIVIEIDIEIDIELGIESPEKGFPNPACTAFTKGFLPATGRLTRFRPPAAAPWLRIDTGVREGDRVTSHYDPMIAKLVAGGADRAAALRRLRQALDTFQIAGLTTNLDFLRRLAAHPGFAAKELDTGFIERHGAALTAPAAVSDRVLALACIAALAGRTAPTRDGDPYSPWHRRDGWRLNDEGHDILRLISGDDVLEVSIRYPRGGGYLLELPGGTIAADGEIDDQGTLIADLGGERVRAAIARDGDELIVLADGATHRLALYDPLHVADEEQATVPTINAPLPGKIIQVLVQPGAEVAKGAPLIVLEAMKMEHTITAPAAGRVARVNVAAAEQVDEGVELLAFEED